MDARLMIFFCLVMLVIVSAFPTEHNEVLRDKRDVMDGVKNAWGEVVKTLTEAGDAVVHVFKPTEKGVIDKAVDSVKGLAE